LSIYNAHTQLSAITVCIGKSCSL